MKLGGQNFKDFAKQKKWPKLRKKVCIIPGWCFSSFAYLFKKELSNNYFSHSFSFSCFGLITFEISITLCTHAFAGQRALFLESEEIKKSKKFHKTHSTTLSQRDQVNSDSKRLQCQYKESCLREVIDSIRNKWKSIAKHVHTKRIQAQCFDEDKYNDNSRVLQVYFAIN